MPVMIHNKEYHTVAERIHLLNGLLQKQEKEIASKRKLMIGSGDRSDKIRTYNYPQGRVTDHRINHTVYSLPEVISGDLFSFTENLRIAENAERMKIGN